MASAPMTADMSSGNWSDFSSSLKDAVKKKQFPYIVKPCFKDERTEEPIQSNLPQDLTLLIQDTVKLHLALVQVCELPSKVDAKNEYGMEIVLAHNSILGDEFYIPLGIKCPLTSYCKSEQYHVVSQMQDEMPSTVRLDDDFMTMGVNRPRFLEKGTLLHLKKTQLFNGQHYFVFNDDADKEVSLPANARVNLTPVADKGQSVLKNIIEHHPLPKLVHFLNIPDEDFVHADSHESGELKIRLIGSLKVVEITRRDFYVAWAKHERHANGKTTFANVLIPSELSETEQVYVKQFINKDRCKRYIERNFCGCSDFQYIHHSLYMLPVKEDVTMVMDTSVKPRDTAEDSEDSDADYERPEIELHVPPPPLPARRGKPSATPQSPTAKSPQSPTAKSPMSPVVYRKGDPPSADPPSSKVLLPTAVTKKKPRKRSYLKFMLKSFRNQISRSKSDKTAGQDGHTLNTGASEDIDSDPDSGSYLEPIEKRPQQKLPGTDATDYREEEKWKRERDSQKVLRQASLNNRDGVPPMENVQNLLHPDVKPLPPTPKPFQSGSVGSVGKKDGEESSEEHIVQKENSDDSEKDNRPLYSYADNQTLTTEALARQGQTKSDFIKYTVKEVVTCFQICGMGKLATLCDTNTLDGQFLAEMESDEFRNDPFYLKTIEVSKVKRIINDGWRPKR